jgi:hypothetical protein
MSTAPRDGRNFYVQFTDRDGLYPAKLVNGAIEADYDRWLLSACVGWLDIEALVRDSARLDKWIHMPMPLARNIEQIWFDAMGGDLASPEKIVEARAAIYAEARAAIDKEMERG